MAAVDERLGIDAVRYPVPAHANRIAYSLGGLTAVSLFILIVTGIILGQFYNPDPALANASVRHIVNGVYLGRFVRGVHFWAAEAMYVLIILHLLRIYFTGSYKRPREANWLIGVGMFALTIGGPSRSSTTDHHAVTITGCARVQRMQSPVDIPNSLAHRGSWISVSPVGKPRTRRRSRRLSDSTVAR
jgi:Cytochrome b/b6/petB